MKTKIFIVTWTSYTESDNYLYQTDRVFTDEQEAKAFYEGEMNAALDDVRGEWDEEGGEYPWTEQEDFSDFNADGNSSYKVSREVGTEDGYQIEVKFETKEIDIPFVTDRTKYGMTLKEIRDEIAAFKDCSFTEATKKAETFRQNCCVPLTWVVSIRLSFGKYSRTENGEVVYYGENRDTLHIEYTDREGDCHQFSIIE